MKEETCPSLDTLHSLVENQGAIENAEIQLNSYSPIWLRKLEALETSSWDFICKNTVDITGDVVMAE